MNTRILFIAALAIGIAGIADLPAQNMVSTGGTINITEQLAPWSARYNARRDWPRGYGYKPYKRFEWDMKQRGWPNGSIPQGAYWDALQQRARMARTTLDEPWTSLGPYNHGGRARVLRFHPGRPDTMYAGAVSGGLWKSVDAGASWFPMTDGLGNLAVGCFEIDPNNPNIMYLGTGEGYYNGDAVTGIGLLKSTDGGFSWNPTGLAYPYSYGQCILKISIDPRNGQILLASTMDSLCRSINGGQTWNRVLQGQMKDLVRDPLNPDVLLCAAGNPYGSQRNGVYRSTDNGVTWTRSSAGLPDSLRIGRIVLAFYPANPQQVWAGISGTFAENDAQCLGIFRSLNNGQTWTQTYMDNYDLYHFQGWYNMAIAVKPDDSSKVYSAGVDIYRSNSTGTSWTPLTEWWREFGHSRYVHADHHEIVFHPNRPNEMWEVTDGGVFKSTDAGSSWTERNNGFVTFQYYAMGNATLDTGLAYGGTQDNGTFRYHNHPNHEEVFGGDGGYCVVDYTNNNTIYIETQNGNRLRSDDGGNTFQDINPGIDGDGAWVTPMALDPFDHLTIYTTTVNGKVWKSPNQGRNTQWVQVGQTLDGEMQVLSCSPLVPGRLFAGSWENVYRYTPAAGEWTNITANLPIRWVTRVVPDPRFADVVYVTLSGFGSGHVWKSTTGGGNWQNISGNLPDVPFQDLVVDPREPLTLYAGGDIGIFRTTDGGAQWHVYGDGLPAARVDDMELQSLTGMLRIATHGRGMWQAPTSGMPIRVFSPNGGETLAIGEAFVLRWSGVSLGGQVRIEINRSFPSAAWDTLFAAVTNDGEQNWTVTGPASDHARFRISHLTISGERDTSDADIGIAQPAVVLLQPAGGDTILSGRRDTLRFRRILAPENLQLLLNRDYPDGVWETTTSVIEDSLIQWTIRLPATEHARLRLVSTSRPQIFDETDGDFTIRAPQMTLISPNGGEQLPAGVPVLIRWSAAEHNGSLRLMLNRNYPSGPWSTITPNTANSGQYSWTPSEPASQYCRIRMSTAFDPLAYVESASNFTIWGSDVGEAHPTPADFRISEPHPNPFNPATQIVLDIPAPTRADVRVYNRIGQEVAVLAAGNFDAGSYRLTFDGGALPSGIYFIHAAAYGQTRMMKAVLVK